MEKNIVAIITYNDQPEIVNIIKIKDIRHWFEKEDYEFQSPWCDDKDCAKETLEEFIERCIKDHRQNWGNYTEIDLNSIKYWENEK